MDLFGHNILDFPDEGETLFLGRLPRISESEYLQDLGLGLGVAASDNNSSSKVIVESNVGEDDEWSNDSAVFTGSDVASEASSEGGGGKSGLEELDILQEEDEASILCSAVAFDKIQRNQRNSEKIAATIDNSDSSDPSSPSEAMPVVEDITFEDIITEDGVDDLISEDGGINLDDSGFLGSSCPSLGEEVLGAAGDMLIANIVPDDDEDEPGGCGPDLHVPMSLDQMLDEDGEHSEVEDMFGGIDFNAVLEENNKTGDKCKSLFKNLIGGAEADMFDDPKELSDSAEKSINIKEELISLKTDTDETNDYGLEQFDFDLCNNDMESLEHREGDSGDAAEAEAAANINNLLASMFEDGCDDSTTDYNDLLNSIMSESINIDPEYFNNYNDDFDIDSVDPTCSSLIEAEKEKHIKEEVIDPNDPPQFVVNVKKDPGDEYYQDNFYWMREHDYSLPMSSSLFLTPPHSPGDDSDEELVAKKSHLVRSNLSSKARSQIVKFNKPKDLKFVMTLPVRGGDKYKKVNARSILKNKIMMQSSSSSHKHSVKSKDKISSISSSTSPKSAKELVREILEKRSLAQHIQEKREYVKNMKKRMRQDDHEESRGPKRAKVSCLDDVRSSKGEKGKHRKFEEERELHNSMERQRRIEMKDAFDELKAVIPEIAKNDKVSKLNILNTARDYYCSLRSKVDTLQTVRQREEARRTRLLEQLNLLQIQQML